jgi:coproporphyrinogen III oxidase
MKLICDDYNEVYVWVDDADENVELSPHFDYEEDAIEWHRRIKQELNNENSRTNNHQHVLHHEARLWVEP